MSRDWKLYLEDIIIACKKVIKFTEPLDFHKFTTDEKTYLDRSLLNKPNGNMGCLNKEQAKELQEYLQQKK